MALMLSYIRGCVKRNYFLLKVYEFLFQRKIDNLYGKRYEKKVLLSYSTYHFSKKSYLAHSNYQESSLIAEIFDSFGYQVDVVNNNKPTKVRFSDYDIIFGEGLPLYQALTVSPKPIIIYYGTGSHPFHCNDQSYKRLIDFFHRYGGLVHKSMRTNDQRWGIAASLADAVICIGNETTKKTFTERGVRSVFSLDPTFHKREDATSLAQQKDFSTCRKSMLWFGSYGLLHKGLDLAVEAVRERPNWTLHVCGYTPAEADFLELLKLPKNVVVHGFINVNSDEFKELALKCGFVILPSCSEGTATAVITTVGNGAMVPIVTKECGYDVDKAGFLIQLDVADIVRQLDELDSLDSEELKQIAVTAQRHAISRYTIDNFTTQLRQHLKVIINSEVC